MFTSSLISTLLHKSRFTTYTSFNLVWPLSAAHSVEEEKKKDDDDDDDHCAVKENKQQRKHNLRMESWKRKGGEKDTQDEHFRGRVEGHDAALDGLIEAGLAGDDAAPIDQFHRRVLHFSGRRRRRCLVFRFCCCGGIAILGCSYRSGRALDMQTEHGGQGSPRTALRGAGRWSRTINQINREKRWESLLSLRGNTL